MTTGHWLLVGAAGLGAWYLFTRPTMTNVPVNTNSGAVYVPPPYAVPTYGGRPSPSAPGAAGWGLVPPVQGTSAAEDAKDWLTGIGAAASGIGSALGDLGLRFDNRNS